MLLMVIMCIFIAIYVLQFHYYKENSLHSGCLIGATILLIIQFISVLGNLDMPLYRLWRKYSRDI